MKNKILEFMGDGSVTMKTVRSPINGVLTVKWDLYGGYQIMGGGLWQVGGPVETVWKAGMRAVTDISLKIQKALILGVGGGTTAKLIRKNWPPAQIIGVDIDPLIVELGNEYLGLKKLNIDIHIADAFDFTKTDKAKYDLICIDTYVGDTYPAKLANPQFLKQVEARLNKNGVAIFNRIFGSKDRKLSDTFEQNLKSVFSEVKEVYPSRELVNVIYVCSGTAGFSREH